MQSIHLCKGRRKRTEAEHNIEKQKTAWEGGESIRKQKQAHAYCEGIDGLLEAVSFPIRGGPMVPKPAAWPGHLRRLLAVHWRLPCGPASVGCLCASCTLCHDSSLASDSSASYHDAHELAVCCTLCMREAQPPSDQQTTQGGKLLRW